MDKKIIWQIVGVIVFIISMWLIIAGQKQIGFAGLSLMLVGTCGLLFLLWSYNKQHQ